MAVPVGFEPTVDFHPHNFSRVAPSAARTRYRQRVYTAEFSNEESVAPSSLVAWQKLRPLTAALNVGGRV